MEHGFDSSADYYKRGPYSPFVQAMRSPADVPVHLVRTRQPAGAYPDPAMPDISLQIAAGGVASRTWWDVGTGRISTNFAPGEMVLAPPNTQCHYEVEDTFELLVLNVPLAEARTALIEVSPSFNGDFGLLHGPSFSDPLVRYLVEAMWREAANGAPRGRLFLDSAVISLLTTLLSLSEKIKTSMSQERSSGDTSSRVAQALDYLRDNYTRNIALIELASCAGLSPIYFSRQFKKLTGIAPHQYLIKRRVDVAKRLLTTSDLPIAQVAFECGFSGQDHLTKLFRRTTGTTPAAYRRAVRS